jgi:hypothetical protein
MTKKEELNRLVLNSDCYDMTIYKIINSGVLDEIIDNIDDKCVLSDINSNEIISSYEQFLDLLNKFIVFFKKKFNNLSFYIDELIKELIKNNYYEFSNYLLSKHYLGDNKYIMFFEDNMNRLSILNFVKNIEYSSEIKKLLKLNNIKIKNIKDYSFDEVLEISDLLSDLIFCYSNEFHTVLLFTDMSKVINDLKSDNSNNNLDKIDAVINDFDFKCKIIIDSYNNKRKYLKYFKDIS